MKKDLEFDLQRFDVSGTNNNIITAAKVAREALMVLKNTTVMAQLVNRDYDSEFYAKQGDTVNVRRPASFEADLFDPVTGIKLQDVKEGAVPVILDKLLDVSFAISSKELSLDLNSFSEQLVQPAMLAIEQKIDENLCALYADIPYYVGSPGNTPDSVSAITGVRKEMNDNKVPMAGRVSVLDSSADAKLLELDAFNSASRTGETDAIIDAQLGRKFGFNFYMDQNIKHHENGDITVSATTKLGTVVKKDVNRATLTDTVLTGTIKRGTIFKIAGDDRPYVIARDAEAASNSVTVDFYPAARQDFPQNAVITVVGDHTASLAFHRNAFCMVTRPLDIPLGAASSSAIVADNGIAVRVVFSYDINKKKDICSIDLLCGFKTMIPELACRLVG